MLSVEIKDLSKSYGKTRVLERVDLKLQEPECYALTGKSGGGKTTLLRLLLGLELPDSGEVIWKREGLAVRPRLSAVRMWKPSFAGSFRGMPWGSLWQSFPEDRDGGWRSCGLCAPRGRRPSFWTSPLRDWTRPQGARSSNM